MVLPSGQGDERLRHSHGRGILAATFAEVTDGLGVLQDRQANRGGGGTTIGCHRRDGSLVFIRQGCQAGLGEMKGNKRDEQRGGKG